MSDLQTLRMTWKTDVHGGKTYLNNFPGLLTSSARSSSALPSLSGGHACT